MINLPTISQKRIAIHVKPAAEHALRSGHPWVFDQSIRKQSHEGQAGDLAVIFDRKRRFLAIGLYDPDSIIRVRVLQHRQQAQINAAWFADHIQAAVALRAPLAAQQTTGYRLVHGENDGLPGLVVDRYAETLVIKLYSAAWLSHLQVVIDALQNIHPGSRLILRMSRNMHAAAQHANLHDGQTLIGEPPQAPVIFLENGLRFAADVVNGHKTGFFFDQRENRARVREYALNRRVLDVFSYNGGFSLYAAAGGASVVTSLDVSAPALESAQANFALNAITTPHHCLAADAFDGLNALQQQGQTFDMIIVDPPAFAKKADEIKGALTAYMRLTTLALPLLKHGGTLVMASCSSQVRPTDFFSTIMQTVNSAGYAMRDVVKTSHALDHPIGFPEGEYLKCLFATVT